MNGYQLKITIKGSKPPIWRRVVVPEKITFADLDEVIEFVFGWTHSHLYEFRFPQEDVAFMPEPDYDEEDAGQEYIDKWVKAYASFTYTYDFGDWWEHQILVEKIVPYENRYPVVLKSKGPNMIEDCGGIWGFYDVIGEAAPFEMEEDNQWMKENLVFEQADKAGEMLFGRSVCLQEVYEVYKKDTLINQAKSHHLTGYSKFNKRELAEWLRNNLMETKFMERMLKESRWEEVVAFEDAMENPMGICIDIEQVEKSSLLASYGAYTRLGTLMIPADVQEQYHKVCTAEFRQELEDCGRWQAYCDSAFYLYGIIPIKKLVNIYNSFETEKITIKRAEELCHILIESRMDGLLLDCGLVDGELAEEELYKCVLKEQADLPFYIPNSREEFLRYGELEYQEPDSYTESCLTFLEKDLQLKKEQSYTLFLTIQDGIRKNADPDDMIELLYQASRKRITASLSQQMENEIRNMGWHTRHWDHRGFTLSERMKMEGQKGLPDGKETDVSEDQGFADEIMQKSPQKIVPFRKEKKIYPNDPCPCGSGKKYKVCCGRKK